MCEPQLGNVGNLGDVYKHAALLGIVQSLTCHPGPLLYAETHAFRPDAPLGRKGWEIDRANLCGDAARSYREIQREHTDKKHYLCSPGIAKFALERANVDTEILLCEKCDVCRGKLSDEFKRPHTVLDNNALLNQTLKERQGRYATILALVDPYKIKDCRDKMSGWVEAMVGSLNQSGEIALLVFDFNHGTSEWPILPKGIGGPVGTLSRLPYHLAVYASAALRPVLTPVLGRLESKSCEDEARVLNVAPRKWLLAGIDLAWGNINPSGYARWRDGRIKVEGTLSSESLREVIKADAERSSFALLAIDAPLSPPTDDAEGLPWERLFKRAGHPPLMTDAKSWHKSGLPSFSNFLADSGFRRLAEAPLSLIGDLVNGVAAGRWYIEVYPRNVLQSLSLPTNYKFPKNSDSARRATAWSVLEQNIRTIFVGRCGFPAIQGFPDIGSATPTDEDTHKAIEDQHDALWCLYVALRLAGITWHPSALYLVGGYGDRAKEGSVVGPLSAKVAEALRQNDVDVPPLVLPLELPSPEQQAIITNDHRVVSVIARAGSGKTRTMVWRAGRVVQEDPSSRVLMLTFTRHAAADMQQQIESLDAHSARVSASTYHGQAYLALRAWPHPIQGWPLIKECQLLNEIQRDAALDLFSRCNYKLHLKPNWADELSKVLNSCDAGKTIDETLSGQDIEGVWGALLAFYREHGLLDFDIIMLVFDILLRTNPDFLRTARDKYTHLIADEFQDTNLPQLRSFCQLVGDSEDPGAARQAMIVGDDFQTIYRFRGAVPKIFEYFSGKMNDESAPLPLRGNWRSLAPIVKYANGVGELLSSISEHEQLCAMVGYSMVARRDNGEIPPPVQFHASVVHAVQKLLEAGLKPGDIVVLANKNDTLRGHLQDLDTAGIPAALVTFRPKDAPGFRIFVSALQIAFSEVAIRQIASAWTLVSHCGDDPVAFIKAWRMLPKKANCTEVLSLCARFGTTGSAVAKAMTAQDSLQDRCGLDALLERLAGSISAVGQDRAVCAWAIEALVSTPGFKENPGLVLSEMTRRDFAGRADKGDTVRLCTIHGFKGLESPGVVLSNDGFMESHMAEDLRLNYVARTRARDRLWVVGASENLDKEIETMECMGCHKNLKPGWVKCPHCGTPVGRSCPICGKPLESGWVACPYCGKIVEASSSLISAPATQQPQQPKTLKDLLNLMHQKKVKCHRRVAEGLIGKFKDKFNDITNTGLDNEHQALICKGDGTHTAHWNGNVQIINYVKNVPNQAKTEDQLKKMLGI